MTLRTVYDGIPRSWRARTFIRLLFAFELVITIPALALFGIAQPDLYRTSFWQEGYQHGWNSSPESIIYAYANYKPISTPIPWRASTTYYLVIITVVSLFSLLLRVVAFICKILHPVLALLLHIALAVIYAVGIWQYAGPDTSDPKHPQPGAPWYITKSCGPPVSQGLHGYCQQAKAGFACLIIIIAIYAVHIILALVALYPTKQWRAERRSQLEDQEARHQPWEMLEAPRTPGTAGGLKSPTTPRTKAFNILSSKGTQPKKTSTQSQVAAPPTPRQGNAGLTLKHHVAMNDDEAYKGPMAR